MPLRFEPKTFKDLFDQWIEDIHDGERRECTIEHYRKIGTKYLVSAFGKFALTDITDTAITRLYKSMRKKYAPATIRLLDVILSSIFKAAEADDLVLRNPMRKVKAPEKPEADPVAMTPDETQKFLDAANSTPKGFMFRLAYFLVARPCEYLGLQWGDVDWKAQTVHVQRRNWEFGLICGVRALLAHKGGRVSVL